MAKTGGLCWYCGLEACEVDHIIPFSLPSKRRHERPFARNDIRNLLPSCVPCNRRKANKSIDDFRRASGVRRFWGETFLPTSSYEATKEKV